MKRGTMFAIGKWCVGLPLKCRVIGAVVACFYVLVLAAAVCDQSPAVDELGHLCSGISYCRFGRFEFYRVNPPLAKLIPGVAVQTVSRPKSAFLASYIDGERDDARLFLYAGDEFLRKNRDVALRSLTVARWAGLVFALIGAWVAFVWAGELFGRRAGWMALGLWCADPLILGHAPLLGCDVPGAAMGLLAGYAFWRWLDRPTFSRAMLAGVALGLAELTKFTWLILFVLLPLLLLIQFACESWRARSGDTTVEPQQTGPANSITSQNAGAARWVRVGQLVALLYLCICLINVGYLCEGSLTPLKEYDFASESLAGPRETRGGSMGNRFRGTWLGEVPVPLPYHYLSGIDIQKVDFERDWRCYLAGTWKPGGWWYFYLVALAVKLPLGTISLGVLAVVFALHRVDRRKALLDQLPLLVPPLAIFVLASSQTHFTTHVRYVLPAFPFAFVWLSQLVSPAAAACSKWYPRLAWSCLAATVFSSALAVPHSLSYFNELAGGMKNGHRWLLNSNVDWGQDLLFARDWLKRHAPGRPFGLVHFGYYDARLLGMENYTLPPEFDEEQPPANPTSADGPQPGLYLLSVNALHGHDFFSSDGKGGMKLIDRPIYSYFQRLTPVARIGGSMVIYDVSLQDANRLRRELKLPLIDE